MGRHCFAALLLAAACGAPAASAPAPAPEGPVPVGPRERSPRTEDAAVLAPPAPGAQGPAPAPTCPAEWTAAPNVDPAIAVPAGAGHVVLHVAASGTQDYACAPGAHGGAGWKLVGPDATLADCTGKVIGSHFASDAGPEWKIDDGSYAIAHKAAQYTPDGGAKSAPWLLLDVVAHGDAGVLDEATYVQRVRTDGGVAPASKCGAHTKAANVPYTADYYLYGR
ncbi:MAG TPA: DUF3455 domain-containing protein [Polyangiaceae bacterium]